MDNARAETARKGHIPGEMGIWMFIFGDMLVFTLFFLTFAWYRHDDVALYRSSQHHLNLALGVLNTFFMLTSSWCVASGVKAARRESGKLASALFFGALLCGLGFGVVKFLEYGEKIQHGITPATNDFYMYYFVFTGIHFMHVLIGMGVLTFLMLYARRGGITPERMRNIESGASFWHVVDLLWIVLFALIYLAP